MYTETYRKKFIEHAAIRLMAEVVRDDQQKGIITPDMQGDALYENIEWAAQRAATMAFALADALAGKWMVNGTGDGQTTFFDPDDQPTDSGLSRIADEIHEAFCYDEEDDENEEDYS